MTINTQWSEIKKFIDDNELTLEWIIVSNRYYISVSNKALEVTATIPMADPMSSDQADFEANYKR